MTGGPMKHFLETDGTEGPVTMPRLRYNDAGEVLYPDSWTFEDALWAVFVLQNRADAIRQELDRNDGTA